MQLNDVCFVLFFLQGAVSSLAELAPGTSFRPVLGDTSVSAERYRSHICFMIVKTFLMIVMYSVV